TSPRPPRRCPRTTPARSSSWSTSSSRTRTSSASSTTWADARGSAIDGRSHRLEQPPDLELLGLRVTHLAILPHHVLVAAPDPLARDVAGLDQRAQDPMSGALRDADTLRDRPDGEIRLLPHLYQDHGVIREERPLRLRWAHGFVHVEGN